jgi:hypothetical protein
MKRMSMVLAALAVVMVVPLGAMAQNAKQDGKKVQGAGCVEAGVEAGCLIVKDIKSGKVYNILVKDPRPRVGEGIEFTGTLFDGVTMCMQGTAVEVASWEHKDTLKCGAGEKKK